MANQRETATTLPVILAGGFGTRLWPLSRELYPKQFLRLVGDNTLLQQTLLRARSLRVGDPWVICHQEHRFVVAEQCRACGVDVDAIQLEPRSRSTAPATALAAFRARLGGADPMLLVMPADHHVADEEGLRIAVGRAVPFAESGRIVVFGIHPSRPETGYGYIRAGRPATSDEDVAAVAAFTEKPARAVAEGYLAQGGWYWNSGMFLFRASVYLDELKAHRPDIHEACEAAIAEERSDLGFHRVGEAFERCPAESIDRAVMEQTRRAVVVRADVGWSDIGTWDSLARVLPEDDRGNTTDGDVVAVDTSNCHLSGRHRLVAAVGVDDLVVVETPDAVLVADRNRSRDVALAVTRLREASRGEHRTHTTDYRPWGRAETLQDGDAFRVKRLTVERGGALSLQMHRYRSEHWVVVSGVAEVVRGKETYKLAADKSTYIPAGVRHRLTNAGEEPLVVIEVQTGSWLSEDDIVRFEDAYARG